MTTMFVDLDFPGQHTETISIAKRVRNMIQEEDPEELHITVHDDGFDVEVSFDD